jgi:hypothetical protein
MDRVQDWENVAYNQATESENRIHADDVARRYGFRGGLVPGVTVYAYLVHPALVAWGRPWLERGAATVSLVKPLYDEDRFRVATRPATEPAGDAAYEADVVDSAGVTCATGRAWMPSATDEILVPRRRGDPRTPRRDDRPPATRDVLERLRESGMGALEIAWDGRAELDRYVRDPGDAPALVRPDGDGLANPAFTLGLANFALAANVCLGPWIHVQSDVRHHAAIERPSSLVVESRVADLFERSGHEFVDLDVAVFVAPDRLALTARHRAIYRLREPA